MFYFMVYKKELEVVDERAIKGFGEMRVWRSNIGLWNYELFGCKWECCDDSSSQPPPT